MEDNNNFGLEGIFFDDPTEPTTGSGSNTQAIPETEEKDNVEEISSQQQEFIFETPNKDSRSTKPTVPVTENKDELEVEYNAEDAKTYFDFLKQNNLLAVGDDFEFDGSAEKLQEAHDATIQTYKESAYGAIMSALPENLQGLLQYALAGGDDYDQFLNQSASFDIESVAGQEAVIRYFYKNTANWDDKKIDRYISKLDEEELSEEAQDLNIQIDEANKDAQKAVVQAEEDRKKVAIESHKALQANIAQTIDKAGYIEQSRKANIKNFMFNPIRRADGSLTEYSRVLQSIQSNPDHLAQLADLLFDYDKDKGISYQRFEKSAKTTLTKDLKRHLEQSTSSKVNGLVIPGKALKNSQSNNKTEDIDWKAFLGN